MKIKPKQKNRNPATKWQKIIISLVDDIFTPSKIFFIDLKFSNFLKISQTHREREKERVRVRNSMSKCEWEMETRENQKKREKKKRYNFFFFFFFEAKQRKMKIKNKGKVYPSPSSSSSSSSAIPWHSNGDFLSVLKLLPTAILALASVLSLEDREVLAYMITRSIKTTPPSPITQDSKRKPPKNAPNNHNKNSNNNNNNNNNTNNTYKPPMFECDCFDCYTSYWFK